MHVLLLILLFVSPAFVTPEKKVEHLPVLTFIPANLVDDPFYGGGSPKPPPQEIEPPPPKPSPPRQVAKPPTPKPKPEQPKKETPKKVEKATPKPETKKPVRPKRVIKPSFTRSSDDSKKREKEKAQAAEAKRLKAERTKIQNRIAKVGQNLRDQLSKSSTIKPVGPGGAAYANYAQVVKSIYERAWNPPAELDGNLGTVKVEVVIARSGNVTSAKITRGSGNAKLDRSVERALQIKHIAPFPKGTRDLQRTFIIDFNLKAKRFTG